MDSVSAELVGITADDLRNDDGGKALENKLFAGAYAGVSGGPSFLFEKLGSVDSSKPPSQLPPVRAPPQVPVDPLARKTQGDALAANAAGPKLPVNSMNWDKRRSACTVLLTANGFDVNLVLDPFFDPDYTKEQIEKASQLPLSAFCLTDMKLVDDLTAGFALKPSIPYHIYAVAILVHGKTKKSDFQETLYTTWTEVVDFISAMVNGRVSSVKKILDAILQEHIKDVSDRYRSLLVCSDSKGICKKRGALILRWVKELKIDGKKYWAEYRSAMKAQMLQESVNCIAKKAVDSPKASEEEEVKDEWGS